MSDKMKAWIDNASYEALLSRWRFAPAGSPWFQGDVGKYYVKVMAEKRAEIGEDAACSVSKSLGWDR